jgi:uncharacterized membrane protein
MRIDRLRVASIVLAVLGLAIAAYLTYVHARGLQVACLASGGCEQVQSSRYADVAGVPVALLGLAGYAAILAAVALPGESARLAAAGLTLVGLGFSGYLSYRELFTIKAICQWCVASALIMAALSVLAIVRFLRAPALGPSARWGAEDAPARPLRATPVAPRIRR